LAVDDTGRVWFTTHVNGGGTQTLFVWDNGQIRKIASVAEPWQGGGRPNNFGSLRPAGSRLLFTVYMPNAPTILAESDGVAVRTLIKPGDMTSFGVKINSFHNDGRLRPLPGGGIAYMAHLDGSGRDLIVRHANGEDVVITSANTRLLEGIWVDSVHDAVPSDGGRIFFTATTLEASGIRTSLYLATPR
jgi:hypothetical protein